MIFLILSFSLIIAILQSPHPLQYNTPSTRRPTMCIIAIGRVVLTPDDRIASRAVAPPRTAIASYCDRLRCCSTLVHEFHLTLSCSCCRRGGESVISSLEDERCCWSIIARARISTTSDYRHRAECISPSTGKARGEPCTE